MAELPGPFSDYLPSLGFGQVGTPKLAMNSVATITDMGKGVLSNLMGAWKAFLAMTVKDMFIGPIYAVVENASPIKGLTRGLDNTFNMSIYDALKQ